MAQTGYTPISIYNSATTTNVPTAGNLVAGELAINTADGKLFYKDSSGVVQTIATKATAGLPTTTTGSGAIVLQTSPSITTPTISSGGANFSGSTSGTINLVATAIAGSNTATLPAATGTVMVSGNMPAFSAYLGTNQTITSATYTKIQFNTKVFDTANAYDNATNYRFTPQVAGYYQVGGGVSFDATVALNRTILNLYKNGSSFALLFDGNGNVSRIASSTLLYLNGSTDYVEMYGYISGTSSVLFDAGQNLTWFNASLVRTA